eukprot:m.315691 g.315691  ORF g.315691 m.315691 type:complete len:75 (-) comp16497_c1_seq47:3847-4071(-)
MRRIAHELKQKLLLCSKCFEWSHTATSSFEKCGRIYQPGIKGCNSGIVVVVVGCGGAFLGIFLLLGVFVLNYSL